VFTDVSTLTKDDLNEQIDVIAGGFPCQDISTAGLGAGLSGSRSGLWFQFHRLIKEIQPRYAIIENVSVLRSRGLDQVLWSLAEIGYDAEWHCIPAAAVGAPHRRDRIWIVAYPKIMQRNGCNDNAENGLESKTSTELGNSSGPETLAYPRHAGVHERRRIDEPCAELSNAGGIFGYGVSRGGQEKSQILAHAPCEWGQQRRRLELTESSIKERYVHFWAVEPDVGRVANGIPRRTHRLKQLGNAVVPQIPELIGRAIMEYERVNSLV
jgi:DNA (cytosine-5)-methyltransferase 1